MTGTRLGFGRLLAGVCAGALGAAGAAAADTPSRPALACDTPAPAALDTRAAAVLRVLCAQQAAWNAGDVDGFMAGYWRSEGLRFASGGTVTTGWQDTRDRYAARYDSPAKMGALAFTDLDIEPLSADAALVFGRWRLVRAEDAPEGLFTLLVRQTDAGWVVVHDHTSSAE